MGLFQLPKILRKRRRVRPLECVKRSMSFIRR
nr:MAG TPA: hypothetical protein [Caudoviricetes sp.]